MKHRTLKHEHCAPKHGSLVRSPVLQTLYRRIREQRAQKPKQTDMLEKQPLAYGGELLKTRKGRSGPRTLVTKQTMHLVLRSSRATKEWSFANPKNKAKVAEIFKKFATKYGVTILSVAYAGNHIHAQIKLSTRLTYRPFIRAITSAIAMAITNVSRWSKSQLKGQKFWDYRPFTRVVMGFRAMLNLKDYIHINRLEGWGYSRNEARFVIAQSKLKFDYG